VVRTLQQQVLLLQRLAKRQEKQHGTAKRANKSTWRMHDQYMQGAMVAPKCASFPGQQPHSQS
jgi:hypothetical protein